MEHWTFQEVEYLLEMYWPSTEVQMSESFCFSDNLILCWESPVKDEICVLIGQQIKLTQHILQLTVEISFQLSL